MRIGVLKEAEPGETRVAATPASVAQLLKLGYDVTVEPGAGSGSSFPDSAYVDAGASLADPTAADVVLAVNTPSGQQLDAMAPGATLISLLFPMLRPELVHDLAARPLTALAMDAVPRISRAQSLDVLSSMANIAGYRAVVEAAHEFGRFFTGQVTAAGKVPPAKVLVCGAGVAGLAAIGAAGALGAIVRATDPRPEVAEQVRSLGGEYLAVDTAEQEVSATGYAREMGESYQQREAELYAAQAADVDIIITTALIPGKPAPRLITAEMVATMAPGSVIVDMAAANGGNVEGGVAGERVRTANGVTILGYTDLAGRLPAQASQLYATNIVNLLKLTTPARDGVLTVDFEDVVQRSMTVVHDGELTWPPPEVHVSAPTQGATEPGETSHRTGTGSVSHAKQPLSARRRFSIVAAVGALLFAIAATSPVALLPHLTVFVLAIVIGYYVIGHVHHALHTPLMSVTNAVSGIIIVGALLQLGHDGDTASATIRTLAFLATLLASINVFGGFAVTRRMLSMFSRS
jgi:NAD(P) transhydrogenase subunit alpha